MPVKPSLRAVEPGEQSSAKPKTVLEAAEGGSRLEELRAMRRRTAVALDDPRTPARDLAALIRRQMDLGKEIEAIELAEDEDRSILVRTDDDAWDESAI